MDVELRFSLRGATKEQLLEALEAITGRDYITELCAGELSRLDQATDLIQSLTAEHNPERMCHEVRADWIWGGYSGGVMLVLSDREFLQRANSPANIEAEINNQLLNAARAAAAKLIKERDRQ
jgi:hypothetical protein